MVKDRLFGSVARLESETADWVRWWNRGRLHQGLGYRTPEEVFSDALIPVSYTHLRAHET